MTIHPHLRSLLVLLLVAATSSGCLLAQAPQPETVMVPMRDGTNLATDIYKPPGDGPWPAILTRTPYGKQRFAGSAALPVRLGYVRLVQDMRGRFDSEGDDTAFLSDAWGELQDGYDCIEWIAKQDWCTGSVGTMGGSAMGITQYMAAGAAPPSLKCCQVSAAAPSLYHYAAYQGGVLRKAMVVGWLTGNNFRPENLQLLRANPSYNDLWATVDLPARAERVVVPMIHRANWFDCFQGGNIAAYIALQHRGGEGARGHQVLIIGPGTHGKPHKDALQFPDNANKPPFAVTRQWVAHWLKGEDLDLTDVPSVCYYAMGAVGEEGAPGNDWRTADDWPPPATETPAFLTASGGLTPDRPEDANAKLTYQYDPADPVPTIGGANLVLAKGSMDQREVEDRPDVLLFTSDVLGEPVEVTGHIKARLWISSDCPDTDFTAKLTDVYPDGRSQLICDGIQRARYRRSLETPEPLEPGEVYELEIDMWSTSIILNRGHRIRLAISSSNHPRFSANPNTGALGDDGDEKRIATNALYLGGRRASHIVLPVR